MSQVVGLGISEEAKAEPATKSQKIAAAASFVGTAVEVYDFLIYGTATALVFNKLFFPQLDAVAGTLASFATYFAGYLGRPIGGFLFGHFGDRIGRKTTLISTLLLMAIPTILIGCLPTYNSVGIAAPAVLVILRMCQGIAFGGEWAGAVLLASESAPKGRRALWGSMTQAGSAVGLVLAAAVWAAASYLPADDFLSWGWRIPFLASSVLLVVGLVVRLRVAETPAFEIMRESGRVARVPAFEAFKTAKMPMLLCIGGRVVENSWFAVVFIFVVSYAVEHAHMTKSEVLNAITIGSAVAVPFYYINGLLGNRIGQRGLLALGSILVAAWSWAIFPMIDSGRVILAVIVAMGVIWPVVYTPQASLFAAQFDPEVRYSGLAISTQLAGLLAAGIAPIVGAYLLQIGGGSTFGISIWLTCLGVIGVVCAIFMRPTESVSV